MKEHISSSQAFSGTEPLKRVLFAREVPITNPTNPTLANLTASIKKGEASVARIIERLRILKKLTRGKLNERLLTAIQNSGPMYRALYPRRYKDIPTHTSPKHIIIAGVCSALSLHQTLERHHINIDALTVDQLQSIQEASVSSDVGNVEDADNIASWRTIGTLIDNEVPTYYLEDKLCREVLETDCTDVKIDWNDFDWPHPAMLLVPPKKLYENSPLLIAVCWNGDTVTALGITEKECDYKQLSFMFETTRTGSIGGDAVALMKLMHDKASMVASFNTKDRYAMSAEEVRCSKEFAEKTVALIVNTILAMVAEPNFEDGGEQHSEYFNRKQRKSSDPGASWSPNFFRLKPLREHDDSEYHHGSEGGGVRVHPRRGHWRTMWRESSDEVELTVGRRVRYSGDKRLAYYIQSIDGDAITIRRGTHEEVVHRTEVKPARAEPKWFKRVIVGLKQHVNRS